MFSGTLPEKPAENPTAENENTSANKLHEMTIVHRSRQRNTIFLRNHCDGLNFHDQLRSRQVTDFYKCNRWKVLLKDFFT